jgi:hypothetical protein
MKGAGAVAASVGGRGMGKDCDIISATRWAVRSGGVLLQ